MTERPNIKMEILKYIQESDNNVVNLRVFAAEAGYDEHRVANKVEEMSSLLNWGVSPMVPWVIPEKRDEAEKKITEYNRRV